KGNNYEQRFARTARMRTQGEAVPFMAPLLYFVVYLAAGLLHAKACKVPFHGTLSRHGKARASSVLHMAYRKRCNLL
uniref:hypothetical protein n=1 Tax=Prevotella sp. TaxID=59823 RepID=UPI003FEFE1B8